MRATRKKAISPIIATLLLIAISVAAAIIVYTFTSSLTGSLTQGGGQQVSDQLSMDAYNFITSSTAPALTIRNVGSSSVTIPLLGVFYDGNLCQAGAVTCTAAGVASATSTCTLSAGPVLPATCTTGQYTTITLTLAAGAISGSSHIVRIVTSDGGSFTFTVIAGRAG